MRYAASLPNFGEHWHPRTLARLAREAEEVGWDGFFIWEHILFEPRAGMAMSDPWVAPTAIALATERLKIGPMITPCPAVAPGRWRARRSRLTTSPAGA